MKDLNVSGFRELMRTYPREKKPTPRHIRMKPKNIRDKEKVLTAPGEKEQIPAEESTSRHQDRGTCTRGADKSQEHQEVISAGNSRKRSHPGEETAHSLRPEQCRAPQVPLRRGGSSQGHARARETQPPSGAAPWEWCLNTEGGGNHRVPQPQCLGDSCHCEHVRLLPKSSGGSPPHSTSRYSLGMALQTLLGHLSRKPCVHESWTEEGRRNVSG